jgi:hypothetical protein
VTTYSTLFTKWFEDNYSSYFDSGWTREVKIVVFNSLPVFDDASKDKFYSVESLADVYVDGWVPSTSNVESRMSPSGSPEPFYLQKITVDSEDYLQLVMLPGIGGPVDIAVEGNEGWYLENPDPEGVVQEVFAGAIWYLEGDYGGEISAEDAITNPVLFATKYGVGDYTVAHDGTVYGQFETGASVGDQYVVAYDDAAKFSIGYVLLRLDTPEWEGAHSHHMWIQPQRVNYIANPSFEKAGISISGENLLTEAGVSITTESSAALITEGGTTAPWWRAGSISGVGEAFVDRAVGGVDTERTYCGHVYGYTGDSSNTLVLESNSFPNTSGWFSVSFYASGTGSLKFGLVANDVTYTVTTFICGESFILTGGSATSSFRKFTGLFQAVPDSADYHLRIELSGDEFWVDNVLVDPNPGQYDYFDGNSTDSLAEDFQWMNDSPDAHFSMWYNNYRNSKARLVGAFDTTDGVYKPGLVDSWSPTGASVSVHWDAVSPITPLNWIGDYVHPLSDVTGTAVALIDYELAYTPETIISNTYVSMETGMTLATESGIPLEL